MAITHTVRLSCTGGATSVSGTITATADGEDNRTFQVPTGGPGTDKIVDIAFNKTRLVNFFVKSDQDLKLETNAIDAAGGDTVNLKADVPFWYNKDSGHVNPFASANVTTTYWTNAGATVANVEVRVLTDTTP